MWLEETASWRYPESWEGAELCLRIGAAQGIINGTPKAIALVRDLVQGKMRRVAGQSEPPAGDNRFGPMT